MRWRLLICDPACGVENMAIDEVLVSRARATGECVLRVYGWARPTLSFGRNQTAVGHYDAARLARHAVDVVRRPTGGRAVLHHREVTYSVTAPVSLGALRESYVRINRLLLDGLCRLGVAASIADGAGRAAVPGIAPCFEAPAPGELVHRGRKLVGSAQWRDQDVLLQHGSILVEDDQSAVATLLSPPLPPTLAPATLREAMGRAPALAEVASALVASVRALEDPAAAPLAMDEMWSAELPRARARYADPSWTWRR